MNVKMAQEKININIMLTLVALVGRLFIFVCCSLTPEASLAAVDNFWNLFDQTMIHTFDNSGNS